MKRLLSIIAVFALIIALAGCSNSSSGSTETKTQTETAVQESETGTEAQSETEAQTETEAQSENDTEAEANETVTTIELSDDGILVNGEEISTSSDDAVYAANDIVFYLADQGEEYGEGDESEEHTQEEADQHTVIHITQAGNYVVTGTLTYGQIAVDLGEDSEDDPNAVVTLTLDNADITCTVAPAIICYNAYECGDSSTETATSDVDTSAAGFNIYIADGSENNINGSHVAKVYEEGTTDKLYKYDAAIESAVSINIDGSDGVLNLTSDNEGIESNLHVTVNGGIINVTSSDDCFNANEDYVSVLTINDGEIYANADQGAEGDGIDSNGWVVINGGTICAYGDSDSADSGLDSDNGIIINGGSVVSTGNMYDEVSGDSAQSFIVLSFSGSQQTGYIVVKDDDDNIVCAFKCENSYTNAVISSTLLTEGDYTLYMTDSVTGDEKLGVVYDVTETGELTQLAYSQKTSGSAMDGQMAEGEMPEGMTEGEMPEMPEGEMPEGMSEGEMPEMPEGEMPEGMSEGEMPEGGMPGGNGNGSGGDQQSGTAENTVFTIDTIVNVFSGVQVYTVSDEG